MATINYWRELEDHFLSFLEKIGYTYETVKHYRGVVDRLICYANAIEAERYTPEIGVNFLESEERLAKLKPTGYRYQRTVIRRLNEYADGEKYSPSYLRVNYECPEQFKNVYDNFLEMMKKTGYKYNTIKQYRVFLAKLFQYFVQSDVENWEEVNAKVLAEAFAESTNKSQFTTYTNKLFKYLVDESIVKYNYSGILPKVQYVKRIPSVYSKDEISAILNSIDRTTKVGKRNYTILTLAAYLGMRASDIRLLRFEEVNFETKLIEFVQFKTGVPQKLILLPEISEALNDYIDNARGNSTEPYIFLTHRKSMQRPITANVVSSTAAKYFRESGVKIGDRHHSSHALRMSLASALVAENVPYDVVRTILGHEDPESITHYVKLDTENLRFCALEVPMPSGHFSAYLTSGKGDF